MKKKTIALAVAMVLTLTTVIGGTLAWLQTTSNEVKNTFTFGDIQIKLDETDTDDSTTNADRDTENAYDLIPGDKEIKDPKVTVLANSENCYVFVKITENNNTLGTGKVINYAIDSAWKEVDATNKIYVYDVNKDGTGDIVTTSESDQMINQSILATTTTDSETYNIWVNDALTKENIAAMAGSTEATSDDTYPVLQFTACAVQSDNIEYTEAVNIAKSLLAPTTTTGE